MRTFRKRGIEMKTDKYLSVRLVGFLEVAEGIKCRVYVYTLIQWFKVNLELVVVQNIV
jgi:hypothetical protein